MTSPTQAPQPSLTVPGPSPVKAVRVVLGVVFAAISCAFVSAGAMVLGIASPQRGWLFTAVALLPGLVGGSLIAVGFRRRWGYVLSLVVALALGTVLWWHAPPDHARIDDMVEDQDLDGFTEITREARGNTWCFKGCPVIQVGYQADDPDLGPDETSTQMIEALEAQGWREDHRNELMVTLNKGRWKVSISPATAYEEYGYGDPRTDVNVDWAADSS